MTSPARLFLSETEAQSLQRRLEAYGVSLPHRADNGRGPTSSSASMARPLSADCNLASPSFWLRDERIPATVRTANRAASVAALVNVLLRCLGEGARKRSFKAALRRSTSALREAAPLWTAIFAYTTVYRSLLHTLAVVRLRVLANSSSLAPSAIHKERRQTSSSSSTSARDRVRQSLTHRARVFARCLRILRSNSTPAFLASLLASTSLFLLLPAAALPSATLGLWLISHVSSSAYTAARESGSRLVSWVPQWCNSSLLYALGNGQLLWSFLFESHAFPASYGKVILARSSTYISPRPARLPSHVDWPSRQTIIDHIATLAKPTPTSKPFPAFTSPLLSALKPSRHPTTQFTSINPILDYSPAHPAHTQLMCAMLHPTEPSCRHTFINHFKNEWVPSARFAGAFALLSSLLFRSKSWARDPETQIFKVAAATVQGASVISGSIGTSWALICFFQQLLSPGVLPRSRFFLNGFVSSYIWIHVVPRERRRELALYTARASVQSSWKVLEKRGAVKSIPRGDVAILALGLALLAAMYEAGGKAPATKDATQQSGGEQISAERTKTQLKGATGVLARWLFGRRLTA
ncbi:unnamed protein product [Parajaminaea phylloscopi]